jgi:dTDP-4-amino-4,6-dideoxygalactose transaminase
MKTIVPFLDLCAPHHALRTELLAVIEPVLTQGQFILGPAVERFEENFARYIGVRHCVGVNNGTSALHLTLQALDVGPGDEVITTPHTWISTSWAVSYVGAKPVYVDIDPRTYNLNPAQVETAISPRTKVILPVHLYGQAANLAPLQRLADRYGLTLIEDAAQAHGAFFHGQRVGSLGKFGCFSFYPGKNLGACGEAGAVVTNDDILAERVRCLRDHAQRGRHNHVEVGYNMRMEGVQGAVLDVKLRHLDSWNAARTRIAGLYGEMLVDVPGLVLPDAVVTESHVWHLYVVLLPEVDREEVRRLMQERGVSTGVHYPTPVPFQPVYAPLGYRRGEFPVAERVARQCLSLPIFPEVTDEQVALTAEALRDSLRRCRSLAA